MVPSTVSPSSARRLYIVRICPECDFPLDKTVFDSRNHFFVEAYLVFKQHLSFSNFQAQKKL